MHHMWTDMKTAINRRSFVKNGLAAAGLATAGAGFLATTSSASAEAGPEEHSGRLTKGDAALLRFAAAAEILETDFWVQYNDGAPPIDLLDGNDFAEKLKELSLGVQTETIEVVRLEEKGLRAFSKGFVPLCP